MAPYQDLASKDLSSAHLVDNFALYVASSVKLTSPKCTLYYLCRVLFSPAVVVFEHAVFFLCWSTYI